MSHRTSLCIALPLLIAAAPLGDLRLHLVDEANSEIGFLAESRLVNARGHFAKWEAVLALDPENWTASTVAITIDAASIDTRNDRRDTHLRSADFFDVANHPTIVFRSVSITQIAPERVLIAGDLTMRGTTRRITVPATMVFYAEDAGRFRGQFTINRRDYGVSYNSLLNPVRDDVQVQWDIVVKAQPEPRSTGASH
jgi:polyisoprenoid-binding protein YceI